MSGGCGGSATTPAATRAGAAARPLAHRSDLPPGRIAFRRFLDDAQTQGAVFTIKTDGTGERQLTHPPAGTVDDQPDWSPDGKQIVFSRCSDAKGCRAWIVPAGGGAPRQVPVKCRLASVGCDTSDPAWTPDGRLVVVVAQGRERRYGDARQIQQSALELVDLAGRAQRVIVKRTHWSGDTAGPAVSADGRWIAYSRVNSWLSKPKFAAALFAVRVNGSRDHRVAPYSFGGGDHPAFSPGGRVLFRTFEDDDSRQSNFWTVKPDGSGLRQLTRFPDGTLVRSASYSPDGRWIVHASGGVGGNADLFVMHADGTANAPLTRTKAWESAPDWGPPAS
jgi:Tol biopolymer transport system component